VAHALHIVCGMFELDHYLAHTRLFGLALGKGIITVLCEFLDVFLEFSN
jgi:hypothetical protein